MTDTHLQAAQEEITKIQDRMKERDKQFQLLRIQQETDRRMLRALRVGLEKMKAENAD